MKKVSKSKVAPVREKSSGNSYALDCLNDNSPKSANRKSPTKEFFARMRERSGQTCPVFWKEKSAHGKLRNNPRIIFRSK